MSRRRLTTVAAFLALGVFALPASGGAGDVNGRIAYERRGFSGGSEIWTMNQDGSSPRRLAVGRNPAWSSDGTRIAFATDVPHTLTITRADGSERRVIEISGLSEFDGVVLRPAWSPDGTEIAFANQDGLYVVASDGGPARAVVNAPSHYPAPAWSPDGARIAFVESGNLQVIDADGSDRRTLAGAKGEAGGRRVAWSPDGSRIAFGDSETGGLSIVGLDGGKPTTVVPDRGAGSPGDPSWSPDGSRIVFVENSDICVANADGSGLGRLTYAPADSAGNSASNGAPAWQPLPAGSPPAGFPGSRPGPSADWDRNSSWAWSCELRHAGLGLTGTATPARIQVGSVVTYRLRLENRSTFPIGETGLVDVETVLDGGARVVSVSSTQGRCLRLNACRLGAVFPGERVLVTVRIRATQPGEIVFESYLSRPAVAGDSAPMKPDAARRVTVLGCTSTGTRRADVLAGSVRANVVCGLAGNDRIDPGGGADAVYAGAGDDLVTSRDGARDRIVCGSGKDTVHADVRDSVARDCERVTRR